MHNQNTDCAPTKEERCLEAVKSGRMSIDAEGRVWKHWRRTQSGTLSHYNPPRRADKADKLGYCRIGVPMGNGRNTIVYAHRLVWVYHNGPIPRGLEVNHIDGNKSNNRLSNLEVVTRSENQQHAMKVINSWQPNRGEDSGTAKFTWEEVCQIRKDSEAGATRKELAKRHNVTENCIRSIVLGLTWKVKNSGRTSPAAPAPTGETNE